MTAPPTLPASLTSIVAAQTAAAAPPYAGLRASDWKQCPEVHEKLGVLLHTHPPLVLFMGPAKFAGLRIGSLTEPRWGFITRYARESMQALGWPRL